MRKRIGNNGRGVSVSEKERNRRGEETEERRVK